MGELAIKVNMQILGGGIRRVHHLTSGSSVGDLPGCHMQGRQSPRVCQFHKPVKTYKPTRPTSNLAGGPKIRVMLSATLENNATVLLRILVRTEHVRDRPCPVSTIRDCSTRQEMMLP